MFSFFGLQGSELFAMFCVLLFVEECGVPLPFAPGDLVLVAAGITISTSRLNPAIAILAVTSCMLLGAFIGREIFALGGCPLLEKLANWLRFSGQLRRGMALFRRGGARAVFLGRLTPGLRIHTTEIAGAVRLRRRQFAIGLVPALAIHELLFVGAGMALGPTAYGWLHEYSPRVGPAVFVLAIFALGLAAGWWLNESVRGKLSKALTIVERQQMDLAQ